jgi:hypothetical protein
MKCLEKQSPMIRPVGYGLRSVRLPGALKIRFPGDQIFGQTILVIPFPPGRIYLLPFPGTTWQATFIKSLRDKSDRCP